MIQKLKSKIFQTFDEAVWKTFNKRRPFDYERLAYWIAAEESARFFLDEMPLAENFITRNSLLKHTIAQVSIEGLWLEFGVHRGESIRQIAEATENHVYGFDSFEGLPEDWTHFQKKGRFTLDGSLPSNLPPNISLVQGWFEKTLPRFAEDHGEPIAFLHIDSDLYSSAKTIFEILTEHIVPGSIILFDELLNYPGWKNGEHKAFTEFLEKTGRKHEYFGFASSTHSVAAKIIS